MFGSNWVGATLRHDWMAYIGLGNLRFGNPALVAGRSLTGDGQSNSSPRYSRWQRSRSRLWPGPISFTKKKNVCPAGRTSARLRSQW